MSMNRSRTTLVVALLVVVSAVPMVLFVAARHARREVEGEGGATEEPAGVETTSIIDDRNEPSIAIDRVADAGAVEEPRANPPSVVAPPTGPSVAPNAEAGTSASTEAQRESIRTAIEAIHALRARMAEYESHLRDAGVPPDRAAALMSGVVLQERVRRRMELEGNDPTWAPRIEQFLAARDEIEHDSRLDETARRAAVEALRQRTFSGDDAARFEAWEMLEPPSTPDGSSVPPGARD
jgi:hypothetical protein